MKVTIVESYPGEAKAKVAQLMIQVAKLCGADSGCNCGHCGTVEKAVGNKQGQQAVDTAYKGEDTPFQFIRDLRTRSHDLGAQVQNNIINSVVAYLEKAR